MYYPIDFSETRKKKKQKKFDFKLPKLPAYTWVAVAAPLLFVFLSVAYMDYSAVSKADSVIRQIEEIQEMGGRRQKSRVRKLAGMSPLTDTHGKELYETYTFERVFPILPPRIATVVYSSSGQVIDVLDPNEARDRRFNDAG